jgi:hypothetical protein
MMTKKKTTMKILSGRAVAPRSHAPHGSVGAVGVVMIIFIIGCVRFASTYFTYKNIVLYHTYKNTYVERKILMTSSDKP